MVKVEHIGIAVNDIDQANKVFAKIFGKEHYKVENVHSENVSTSFFRVGDTKIELLEASNPDSAIAKFIQKRGEGIHHIAIEVDDINLEMKRLDELGFKVLYPEPRQGADNKMVNFLHPKTTNGVLIEICQEIKKA